MCTFSTRRAKPRRRRMLAVEVTNISSHGFWLLLDGREVFASFREFPWFADATIQQLTAVQRPSPHHLYWPALDVDLAVESLDRPERYPLRSPVPSNRRSQPTKSRRGSRPAPARRKSPRPRR